MLFKCLVLFLFFLGDIVAQSTDCPRPKFPNGRFRIRQKSKLIKFICFPGYTLIGNKYATCKAGEWDVPLPVCIRPGCPTPVVDKGMPLAIHNGAWVVFFCIPGYKLQGSSTVFCDGNKWNDTLPTCVDTTSKAYLTCNFEDPKLCGWTQDDFHDFDWKRLNRKTPSSFLFTGPSYDHTYGPEGNGYYMYIESTSRLENDTARLISPIFNASLSNNGCFSFWYHMFGKTTGGLRVYQKPVNMTTLRLSIPLLRSLSINSIDLYLLFEKWGNLGDTWFNGVSMLKHSTVDFQIVIEGVRGSSFTSDIAIDDVAILQGENCTAAIHSASTPAEIMPDSCSGRCNFLADSATDLGCGCSASCIVEEDCCPDFYEVCVFAGVNATLDDNSQDQPHTEKLVAISTTPTPTTVRTRNTTVPVRNVTSRTVTAGTTLRTTKIISTTPKLVTTTSPATTRSQTSPSTTKKTVSTTPRITTVNATTKLTTQKLTTPTVSKKNPPEEPDKPTDEPDDVTIVSARWTRTTVVPFRKKDQEKMKFERQIEAHKFSSGDKDSSKSSGTKTTIVTITSLLLLAAVVYAIVWSRGVRGRIALQRLRGRARHDPDVTYLHTDVDDDD